MFEFLKRKATPKQTPVSLQMREVMFGDLSWAQWCKPDAPDVEPWSTFKRARAACDTGDANTAIVLLRSIIDTHGYESRCYIQAWHFLRELGNEVSDAKRLLGVVIEVGLENGLDVLGAYEDCTARYWNFSGAGIVWDRPDGSVDAEIEALFQASRTTVKQIGPWDKPRLPAPEKEMIRLSFLTPSGLHFGQGPLLAFARDGLAGPVIQHGTALMQKLMSKTKTA